MTKMLRSDYLLLGVYMVVLKSWYILCMYSVYRVCIPMVIIMVLGI